MKNKIDLIESYLPGIAIVGLLLFAGCALFERGSRAEYNTLAAVGYTVDGTVSVYFQGVASGIIKTNNVPKVSQYYNNFQAGYRLALAAAQSGSNSPAPASLVAQEQNVLNAVGGTQ